MRDRRAGQKTGKNGRKDRDWITYTAENRRDGVQPGRKLCMKCGLRMYDGTRMIYDGNGRLRRPYKVHVGSPEWLLYPRNVR